MGTVITIVVVVLVSVLTVALAPTVYRGETVARARVLLRRYRYAVTRVLLRRYRYDVKAPPGEPLRWPWPAAPEVTAEIEEKNHGQSN